MKEMIVNDSLNKMKQIMHILTKNKKTETAKRCLNVNCYGMLRCDICNICNHINCLSCNIYYNINDEHVCKNEDIESFQYLQSDSNYTSCPKCNIYISKIEGCSQMYCIVCNTKFDWNTGNEIYNDQFYHNIHMQDVGETNNDRYIFEFNNKKYNISINPFLNLKMMNRINNNIIEDDEDIKDYIFALKQNDTFSDFYKKMLKNISLLFETYDKYYKSNISRYNTSRISLYLSNILNLEESTHQDNIIDSMLNDELNPLIIYLEMINDYKNEFYSFIYHCIANYIPSYTISNFIPQDILIKYNMLNKDLYDSNIKFCRFKSHYKIKLKSNFINIKTDKLIFTSIYDQVKKSMYINKISDKIDNI